MSVLSLPITRLTLREALTRRLVLVGVVLSAVYLALVGIGFAFVRREVGTAELSQTEGALGVTVLTVLALYVVSFLAAFLVMFLAAGAVSSQEDSGELHAVLARPLSRRSWLLQRFLGLGVVGLGYSVGMSAAVLLLARLAVGYGAVRPVTGLALVALQTLVLLALGTLVSTRLSTMAGGAVLFTLFGLAWLAGIVEFIGQLVNNATLSRVGVAVSLLLPSDALWKAASFELASPVWRTAVASQPLGFPFIGSAPAAWPYVAWTVLYAGLLLAFAVRRFARRDL